SHPLTKTLERIRAANSRLHEFALEPLRPTDVTRLVSDALRTHADQARALATLIHEKSGGNPFFAIQFFATLVDERLVVFDDTRRRWEWNIERIRSKGFTENVVDLMRDKVWRLPPATRDTLTQFSCLGSTVQADTLAALHGDNETAVREAMWHAVR